MPTPRRGSLHSRGVAFGYDATGAIASIGTLAAFDHDLDGRPVSRTLNGVTKTFRFGGAIAYSTAGTPIEADLGEVVIKLDGTGNRYRHLDFRGNVLFQTNNAGNVTGQAVYRGFGRFYVSGNVGERGFAGGFEIPSLGLVVLGPRVLDSDTGRFLSQDPVFNAVNQYAYAQGNPVFFWDPTGSSPYSAASLAGTEYGYAIGQAIASAGTPQAIVSGLIIGQATALFGRAWFVTGQYLAWRAVNPDAPAPDPVGDILLGPIGSSLSFVFGAPDVHAPAPPVSLPPNPPRPEVDCISGDGCRIEDFPSGTPDFSGGAISGLSSLTFSIALSFGGALW